MNQCIASQNADTARGCTGACGVRTAVAMSWVDDKVHAATLIRQLSRSVALFHTSAALPADHCMRTVVLSLI